MNITTYLPNELQAQVLDKLIIPFKNYYQTLQVCKTWHTLLTTDSTLQSIFWTHCFQKKLQACSNLALAKNTDSPQIDIAKFLEWLNLVPEDHRTRISEFSNFNLPLTSEQSQTLFSFLPNIHAFRWNGYSAKLDLKSLLDNCKTIKELSITYSKITNNDIQTLLAQYPEITLLHLNSSDSLSSGLFNIIASAQPEHLLSCNLSQCLKVDGAGFKEFLRAAPLLQSLDLSGLEKLKDEDLVLIPGLCPNLEFLYLEGIRNLTSVTLEEIAFNLHKLKYLNVKFCAISENDIKQIENTLKEKNSSLRIQSVDTVSFGSRPSFSADDF